MNYNVNPGLINPVNGCDYLGGTIKMYHIVTIWRLPPRFVSAMVYESGVDISYISHKQTREIFESDLHIHSRCRPRGPHNQHCPTAEIEIIWKSDGLPFIDSGFMKTIGTSTNHQSYGLS